MKRFLAGCLWLVALGCSAQVISYKQLTNYAVGMSSGRATNLTHYGNAQFTNDATSGAAPNIYVGQSDGSLGSILQWNIGGQLWGYIVQSNVFQLNESSPFLPAYLAFWKDINTASIGKGGGTITNNGDLRVTGIAYDQNNRAYVTTIDASNDVRVAAGAGTIVTAAAAGGVMTYTVTSTAGAGATNAISAVSTNGAIGGLGLTSLGFNDGFGNTVSGVSNSGAFTLTWKVDFTGPTNYANAIFTSLSNFASTLSYQIGANATNFGYQIGANATSRIDAVSTALTNLANSKQDGFTALTELGNSGIRFPVGNLESNVAQVLYQLQTTAIPTNSAVSNLTVNFRTNKYYITLTNNLTVTNFAGIGAGIGSDTTIIIEPQLIPRGITYPTLGAASFGIYANTNDNAAMWTTLTNGNRYALTISAFGTNTFWSLSRWK